VTAKTAGFYGTSDRTIQPPARASRRRRRVPVVAGGIRSQPRRGGRTVAHGAPAMGMRPRGPTHVFSEPRRGVRIESRDAAHLRQPRHARHFLPKRPPPRPAWRMTRGTCGSDAERRSDSYAPPGLVEMTYGAPSRRPMADAVDYSSCAPPGLGAGHGALWSGPRRAATSASAAGPAAGRPS
jgi:hypothetical protein